MIDADAATFRRLIETHTRLTSPALVPELRLYLASEITPIWQATEDELARLGVPPPFWAFFWPGGQALARYVLDTPGIVRGRRVTDFACGSGGVAIAAALAGGKVTGFDIDPFATAALDLNCAANQVAVLGITGDPLVGSGSDATRDTDVILAGDIFYEQPMASRAFAWLKACAAAGAMVLVGDPGRTYLPREGLEAVFSIDVPTSRELEDSELRRTTIWRL